MTHLSIKSLFSIFFLLCACFFAVRNVKIIRECFEEQTKGFRHKIFWRIFKHMTLKGALLLVLPVGMLIVVEGTKVEAWMLFVIPAMGAMVGGFAGFWCGSAAFWASYLGEQQAKIGATLILFVQALIFMTRVVEYS